jgi:TP53 regulating kinase-like protein
MSSTAEMKDKGESEFETSPRSEWILISQGAEARVWKLKTTTNNAGSDNNDAYAVCKERFSKAYRHPDLDARLTKSRCRSEAKILEKCVKKTKIRVPKVIRVSPPNLYLEFLVGPTIKSYLQQQHNNVPADNDERDDAIPTTKSVAENDTDTTNQGNKSIQQSNISEKELAHMMGELVGRLHNIGIVHGDLTTSNIMIVEKFDDENGTYSFELSLIDFGLSKSTFAAEEQAVDLYVLERALLSTHPNLSENFFDLVLENYKFTAETDTSGDDDPNGAGNRKKRKNNSQTALQRLEQVRMRGRKRECFG